MRGKNTNSFNDKELEYWFGDVYECWVCGVAHADVFHHIHGRGIKTDDAESSLLNCAPVNNFKCHLQIHGYLTGEEVKKVLTQKTMKFLLRRGYEFTELDKHFINKYKDYYVDN